MIFSALSTVIYARTVRSRVPAARSGVLKVSIEFSHAPSPPPRSSTPVKPLAALLLHAHPASHRLTVPRPSDPSPPRQSHVRPAMHRPSFYVHSDPNRLQSSPRFPARFSSLRRSSTLKHVYVPRDAFIAAIVEYHPFNPTDMSNFSITLTSLSHMTSCTTNARRGVESV